MEPETRNPEPETRLDARGEWALAVLDGAAPVRRVALFGAGPSLAEAPPVPPAPDLLRLAVNAAVTQRDYDVAVCEDMHALCTPDNEITTAIAAALRASRRVLLAGRPDGDWPGRRLYRPVPTLGPWAAGRLSNVAGTIASALHQAHLLKPERIDLYGVDMAGTSYSGGFRQRAHAGAIGAWHVQRVRFVSLLRSLRYHVAKPMIVQHSPWFPELAVWLAYEPWDSWEGPQGLNPNPAEQWPD